MNLTEEITILTDDIHWLTKDQAWHYKVLPKSKTPKSFSLYCEDSVNRIELSSDLKFCSDWKSTFIQSPLPRLPGCFPNII
jgi:type IV pilus assembly protein PilB